ncbi:ABC-type L-amino acid uptake system permease component AapQ [Sesbania bispinosa]|nr:ABC-type L-amino acid uptake system permease component AapQ [Sesbania bispinosa]
MRLRQRPEDTTMQSRLAVWCDGDLHGDGGNNAYHSAVEDRATTILRWSLFLVSVIFTSHSGIEESSRGPVAVVCCLPMPGSLERKHNAGKKNTI